MSTDINLNKNIYNSDGTVNSNRTVDLDGNTVNFDNGNVGINIIPTAPLHVKSTAVPSTNENIVRLEVSDAPNAYLAFNNASTTDGRFVPEILGRQSSLNNESAIYQGGYIDASQDSGTTPVTVFRSALASLTQVVTRPIFAFRNWSTTVMTILANGNVGIGTVTPSEKLEVSGKTKTTTFQMTTSPTAGYVLTSDASGNGTWSPASSGGLTYFTEAQNTAAPNAAVPVDSLTAVSAATNADFALRPKGTGALLAAIPDNTTTGGNKRGTNAIDLQTTRTNADQVASGNNSVVIGSNSKASSANGVAIGVGAVSTAAGIALQSNGNITGGAATASGIGSFAVNGGTASNLWAFAMGRALASGINSFAFGGYFSQTTASGNYGSVAIGEGNTAQGQSSVALGTASSATGSVATAIGQSNTGSGANSTAIGKSNIASGTETVALGGSNTSAGYGSATIGNSNSTAYDFNYAFGYANSLTSGPAGNNSFQLALGTAHTVNGALATAIGIYGLVDGVTSRHVFSAGRIAANGDAQKSTFFYKGRTTDATLTTLATDGNNSINRANLMQLPLNSSFRFKGSIIAKQSGSTNTAAWDVDGVIVKGATHGTTTLVVGNVNLVSNIPGWGTPILSAYNDAFNGVGGLRVQIQGLAATNIQWTAILETAEVIYA